MIEKIDSFITHKGFIIQKVIFPGGVDVIRGVASSRLPSPFVQYRIISADGNPLPFITAPSHADAIQKIDSEEAAKTLCQKAKT